MRRWRISAVSLLASVGVGSALAQPAPPADVAVTGAQDAGVRPPQRIGYGAMPGGLHVAAAETLPQGTVELGLLSGFGYRKGLLAADHSFDRAIGELAIAYAPVANLLIGLSFDGRYDKHQGPGTATDDGYVGDPHLLIRLARPMGKIALGGQLGVWVPGKDAPSVAASAISVDARALVSIDAGFGTLTFDAGFRYDNSAKSVDDPMKLSVADQVSLGVSKFHAALGGAELRIPLGERWYVALEGSTDVFVGTDAPGPIVRGGGMIGVAATDAVSIIGYVEGAKVPGLHYGDVMAGNVVPVPYEPVVTGGLGLQARFGGPKPVAATSHIVKNVRPVPVAVVETADVTGAVVDDAGKPVVGARITVKLKNNTGTAVSDDKGAYTIAKLPIGKTVDGKTDLDDTGAEISAEVANKKPGSATLTLTRGANVVPKIALDPMLPPGQLRGVIINVGTSRPIAGASVAIEPGNITASSGPDGKFTVDLPPGHYKITVTAKGLAQQQLDVNIDPNGVAIKNIDLHK
ncbi:MAG TPA: carboxypeptidase-like regulatory domain-containing protein [Kofleriaceae bacterium]